MVPNIPRSFQAGLFCNKEVVHTVDDIQFSNVLCMMRSNDVPGTVLLASKLKVFQGNSEFPLCISKTPWGLS